MNLKDSNGQIQHCPRKMQLQTLCMEVVNRYSNSLYRAHKTTNNTSRLIMQISNNKPHMLRQLNQHHHRIFHNSQSPKDRQFLKARQLLEARHCHQVDYQQVGAWINGSTMVSNTLTDCKVETFCIEKHSKPIKGRSARG